MIPSHSLYIDGSWVHGSGQTLESFNPATGKALWKGSSADLQDTAHAVESARLAFSKWSRRDLQERIAYIKIFADELKDNQSSLAETISKEMGKPLWESTAEIAAMIQKVDISIEAQLQRCPTTEREHPQGLSVTRHRPHGVVAIFGPFNFPGHLPNGHIVPALLAGNTVILKPSELTPLVAEEILRCWERTGLPKGVLNMLQGGPETGRYLVENPGIDGLFFTGSFHTGQKLSSAWAPYPEKILALEMGGNNPLIIDTLSDIPAVVYTVLQSAYLTSGQRCTCARRLIVLEQHAQQLIPALVEKINLIRVGSYTDQPEPFMGPLISFQAAKRVLSSVQELIDKGAIELVAMRSLAPETGLVSPGLLDVTLANDRADEEIFGPVLQIIRVPTFDKAIEEANKTTYGLAAGLISDSREHYEIFAENVRAGIINWNTPLTGASSLAPFGGVGRSGNHRPGAYYTADYCSYPVASIEAPRVKSPEKSPPGLS